MVLEPPFVPPFATDPALPASTDDARKPTLLSSMVDSFKGARTPTRSSSQGTLPEWTDPWPDPAEPADVAELKVSIPAGYDVSREVMDRFLASVRHCRHPLSFEVIGLPVTTIVQLTCDCGDAPHVQSQLRAFAPDITVERVDGFLAEVWPSGERADTFLADFGLSSEFMLPLQMFRDFEIDPLAGVAGTLAELESGEAGLLQVLFQPVWAPWADAVLYAMTDGQNQCFFSDAPEMLPKAKKKLASSLYAVVIRVAASSPSRDRVRQIARGLASNMAQFADPAGNELIPLTNDGYDDEDHQNDLIARQSRRSGMILSAEELVGLVHLPSSSVRSEKLQRQTSRSKAAPAATTGQRIVLGENTHLGKRIPVGLSLEQRVRHTHVIGASGTGKSTLLLNLIDQDLRAGNGIGVLDPHGDLIDSVLTRIPERRLQDVVLVDPGDEQYPVGFNIFSAHSDIEKTLLASDLVSAFRRLSTSWGDQMTSVLGNAVLAILESDRGGTLADLRRFLVEADFRKEFLTSVKDPEVIYYWTREFPLLAGRPQASILTRLDSFLRPKLIRHMVCQKENRLDFRAIMDSGKIFLVRLAQGAIGEENAYLLGTFLISKFHQLAMSRQDSRDRKPYFLYIDEFQNFITPSMASVLSGARKYNLGLILAHQEFRQLWSRDTDVASAVLSNPCTRICFRLGDYDAQKLAEGFSFFGAKDLQNLGVGEAICRIERSEQDFTLRTSPVPDVPVEPGQRIRERVVSLSRERYGRPRGEVESLLQEQMPATNMVSGAAQPKKEPTRPPTTETVPVPMTVTRVAGVPPDMRAFLEFVGKNPGCFVTHVYASLKLSGYRGDKLKEELIAQGAMVQQETRHGAGGRVAKVLSLTAAGVALVADAGAKPSAGKGGDGHKDIQRIIQEQASLLGWRATIEERVAGGAGQVDVGLEKDGVAAAVEISITTNIDHEIGNLQKCLQAGYDYVIWVSTEEAAVQAMKAKGRRAFTFEQRRRIRYAYPGTVQSLLLEITGSATVDSGGKGGNFAARNQKQLVGVDEAAEILGIKSATLYSWVSQRKISFVKVGRLTKFNRRALEGWLEGQTRGERREDFR